MKLLIIALLLTVALTQEGDTSITRMDFISNFSLGKQDELNRTFTVIQDKFPAISDVTYIVDQHITYVISNISKPHFFYIDSKQKANIEDQQITIYGGYLQADFTFNWTRKSDSGININGHAQAFGVSDEIQFTKSLVDDRQNKQVFWNLTDSQNITFDAGFRVVRVSPENTTEDDMVAIRKAVNYLQDHTSVKDHFLDSLNSIYSYNLKVLLHDERHHIDGQFNYTYEHRETGKKFIVNLTSDLKDVYMDRTGIKFDWITKIKDFPEWKFYNYTLGHPFDVKTYGGIQQFVSFTVYQNMARFAIKNGQMDVTLNRRGWESRFFQFYAGDLYDVIPKVAQNFRADQEIEGNCLAIPNSFSLKKATEKTFNVTMQYDCQMTAQRKKILDFNMKMTIEIEGKPQTNRLSLQIVRFDYQEKLVPYMDYKIADEELAKAMVRHSLNRLPKSEVFGSGWHLFTRDYPHFHVEHDYTLVYDSTHVDQTPALQTE